MTAEKRKFTLHLGVTTATRASILSRAFRDNIDKGEVQKLPVRHKADADLDAYYVLSRAKAPRWMETLSETFELPAFKRKSPASVVVFEEANRIFAATFGYGSKLLNEYEIEADFGIKVAINSVADDALKAVQKSDVASAIQQYAQAAFKSRFGSLGGQNKFEILKRVSGAVNEDADFDSVVGAASLSLTTPRKFSDIRSLANKALQFYSSEAYKKTAFAVVDEFKPVLSRPEIDRLNDLLIENIRSAESSFELSYPQLNPEDSGYVKIYGVGLRREFPDISLDLYKSCYHDINKLTLADLHDDAVALLNDEHDNIGKWSVYRCLIGSLEDRGVRYVLNEGHWYIPSDSIVGPVEHYFDERTRRRDKSLDTFNVIKWKKDIGKKGKTKQVPVYEQEEDYNARIAKAAGYINFDQAWHRADDGTFSKLEVCDLYDPANLRMIHVKRTSRRANLLSYLFEQGQRAANLWQRDDVRKQFIERVRKDGLHPVPKTPS